MRFSRRHLLGLGSIAILGGLGVSFSSEYAQGTIETNDFTIQDSSVTSDGGNVTTLTVSATLNATYDGLNTDADSVVINLYAATGNGDLTSADNQVHSQSFTIESTDSLKTRAGSVSTSITNADVMASDAVTPADFKVPQDGETQQTEVSFRLELLVKSNDTTLVSGASTTTATVTVTNQPKTTGVGGNGETNATGPDHHP